MIANLANSVFGIVLVYLAVLRQDLFRPHLVDVLAAVAAVLIALIAFIARRTDYHHWHSTIVFALAGILLVLAVATFALTVSAVVIGWTFFWAGLLTAFFSLWAAIYRPSEAF